MSLYLDLMQRVLTRELWIDDKEARERRRLGQDWPIDAETMVGTERLKNVRILCERAIIEKIPGYFMECGTWKGGCAIMMAAVLQEREPGSPRMVLVADSFQGCPEPDPRNYPADKDDKHHELKFLAVPMEAVQRNFDRYHLAHHVTFIPGWFRNSLPCRYAREGKLAVLRLDGDLYESTMQCLTAHYCDVSPGGYIIIDDYGCVAGCRKAVDDFRAMHDITDPIHTIDWTGVWWRRSG